MPNCVVKGCKNHSSKNQKQHGITFHTFPIRNKNIKEKWIEVIRVSRNEPSWNPTVRSVVCSVHFEDDDLYNTNKGLRRVVRNGYPKHLPAAPNPSANIDLSEPTSTYAHVPATPIESIDVDPIQPCSSQAHVSATPIESIDVDPIQPCSSQAHVSATPIESIDVDPFQPCSSQTHVPATPIESIDVDPIQPCSSQAHVPATPIESIDVDPIQPCSSQAHVLAARELPSTPIPNIKEESELIFDTPKKHKLRQSIFRLENKQTQMKKKIKTLNQKVRRLKERNKSLKEILDNLIKENYIDTDLYNSLNGNIAVIDIFNVLNKKNLKINIKYTPAMKKFCLTLNYYSPKAYQYVRSTFNTCLPHPKTLAKWYGHIKGEPGFTEEAFQALKAKSQVSEHRPICSLVFDEVSIRPQKIWDGKKYVGFVDIGTGVEETAALASQALVFLLVGINHRFKIPLGYFLLNGISGEQKANLIKICLIKCFEANVDVASLTFDGHSTNFNAIEVLGCQIKNTPVIKTTIPHPHPEAKYEIACFVDPSHVIKLIRNQFESKKAFVDLNNKKVEWRFIEQLNELQNEEGIHLANKLSKRHIHFRNQIMKVKLATQLLSKSVATALKICRSELKLPFFQETEGTELFIQKFNDMFDVYNSRTMRQFDYKKPLSESNKNLIFSFLDELKEYVTNLKVKITTKRKVTQSGRPTYVITRFYKPVIETKCKVGFVGVLINIESLKTFYSTWIETEQRLIYLPTYKVSQDHLEILFSSIRMQGGFNDNPNVKQFKGSYRKLLTYLELKCLTTGNCVTLENIAILNCTSATQIINTTTTSYRHEEEDSVEDSSLQFLSEIRNDCSDLARRLNVGEFDDYKKYIIGYISGSTAHYLTRLIKCQKCLSRLLSNEKFDFHKLISLKDKGGLCYPSKDLFEICVICETVVRKLCNESIVIVTENQHKSVVINILKRFIGTNNVFSNLGTEHNYAGQEHKISLIRCIIEKYLSIRFHHNISKLETISKSVDSKRQYFKKLIQQKGY